jgi:hypothetical protein
MYMEDTGQDGVFYLEDEDDKEIYFLTEFGAFDVEETTKAVNKIKNENCSYDESNLKTSGVAIRASLSTSMLQRIKGLVPVNASGPETLAAMSQSCQRTPENETLRLSSGKRGRILIKSFGKGPSNRRLFATTTRSSCSDCGMFPWYSVR